MINSFRWNSFLSIISLFRSLVGSFVAVAVADADDASASASLHYIDNFFYSSLNRASRRSSSHCSKFFIFIPCERTFAIPLSFGCSHSGHL